MGNSKKILYTVFLPIHTCCLFFVYCYLLTSFAHAQHDKWIDVPYVKQARNECGGAVISMMMQYWGREYTEKIRPNLLASEMEEFFKKHGFVTFAFSGNWADIETHISKGRPLIVAINKDPHHYVIVTGYDNEREIIYLNDPAQRKLLPVKKTEFAKQWKALDQWTLLVLPQQK